MQAGTQKSRLYDQGPEDEGKEEVRSQKGEKGASVQQEVILQMSEENSQTSETQCFWGFFTGVCRQKTKLMI